MTIYERLKEHQDEKYREFQSALVPNIDKSTILGVRTPQMKSIAKEVFSTEEANAFLSSLPESARSFGKTGKSREREERNSEI